MREHEVRHGERARDAPENARDEQPLRRRDARRMRYEALTDLEKPDRDREARHRRRAEHLRSDRIAQQRDERRRRARDVRGPQHGEDREEHRIATPEHDADRPPEGHGNR